MSSWRKVRVPLICALAALALVGFLLALDGGRLQADEVRPALSDLPFRYELWAVEPPDGDEAAFRGIAHGKHGSTLRFSIVIGDSPRALPIPGTRLENPLGVNGFTLNTDSSDGIRFKSSARWDAAIDMAIAIEQRLCLEATGDPCPAV